MRYPADADEHWANGEFWDGEQWRAYPSGPGTKSGDYARYAAEPFTATDEVVTPLAEAPMAPDKDAVRMLRGSIYLAELKVQRLTHAWPEATRTETQRRAIRDAERDLAIKIERAAEEGIAPWSNPYDDQPSD